jgi:hypothetical protein
MEVGITGKICRPFLAQFLPSLTETSHVAWHGAPLEMTEGTKGGAQMACSLRPRCIGEVVPGLWRQSTTYLCDGLITCSEEYYWMCACVCICKWFQNLKMRWPRPNLGWSTTKKKQYINSLHCHEFDPTAGITVQSSYSFPAYWLQNRKERLFSICNITFLRYARMHQFAPFGQ